MHSKANEPALKVVVRVDQQRLDLWEDGRISASFPVSTSRHGLGFQAGSHQTPTGRFVIAEKIGDGEPIGTVFRGRRPVETDFVWESEEDLITSRILWLDGTDPENANTRDRFIYIHGTNREGDLSTPASHGCIRMANADVVRLFERVPTGTKVEILTTGAPGVG